MGDCRSPMPCGWWPEVALEEESGEPSDPDWSTVSAGRGSQRLSRACASPDGLARIEPGPALQATLRPLSTGRFRWLYLLHRLGLGACLRIIGDWAKPFRYWSVA